MAEIQSRVLARAVATATRDALARRESIALLHGSEAAEVMKSKRAGGMDAGLLAVSVEVGKIRQLQDGKWYVHCKHCAQETTLQARNEEEAYGMLNERKWRLSMPGKKYEKRNWSCPSCAELWPKDTTPTATDAAGSVGQLAAHAAAPSSDGLYSEVEQLEAVLKELKVLVEGHVQVKQAHVDKFRKLRRKMVDLKAEVLAEVTAAQHQPPVSPPGIPPTSDPPEPTDS